MKNDNAAKIPRWLPRVPFLIAEAGVNHNGSLARALTLVEAAARAGADAVKFQTFSASALASTHAPKAAYQRGSGGRGGQLELLRGLELSREAHRKLFAHCRKLKILFLSTPFDEPSADFLDELGVAFFKIPSGELTNLRLVEHIARKGKPVLMSTGMSTMAEVSAAVSIVKKSQTPLILLHCVSCYPAPVEDANLRAMATLAKAFKTPIGYSDHTIGAEVAVAAAALGACVIEKHFTLDKNLPGPDHVLSLNPHELVDLVNSVRNAARALGDGIKAPRPCEGDVRRAARRSVVLKVDAAAGATLSESDLTLKRPGTGIPPSRLRGIVGRRLKRSARADTVLTWGMLK